MDYVNGALQVFDELLSVHTWSPVHADESMSWVSFLLGVMDLSDS